jgi:hypothetical protein
MALTKATNRMIEDSKFNAGDWGVNTTNTVAQNVVLLQTLIESMGGDGGIIVIPKGCKFSINDIDGSVHQYNLEYWARDDLYDSAGVQKVGSAPGTNELMHWSSNWKQDSGGTTDVNEWRFEAPYHPGIILNNREEITHSGAGDDNVGQASVVYKKNTKNQWQLAQGHVLDKNYFGLGAWEVRETHLIDTTTFSGTPSVGDIIIGSTSGAKGKILVVTTGVSLLVSWMYGEFVAGETLAIGADVSTDTLSAKPLWSYNNKPFVLCSNLDARTVGVNTPPDKLTGSLDVGGTINIAKSTGGGYGTAAARIALMDVINSPTEGGSLSINTGGDLQLLDHTEDVIGAFNIGPAFTVTLKDAPTGNSVTPTQSCYYRESAGIIHYSIFLLNINTAGLTAGNQIHIVGLPVQSRSTSNAYSLGTVLPVTVASTLGIVAKVVPNTLYMTLFDVLTTGSTPLLVSAITSGTGDLTISGSYQRV